MEAKTQNIQVGSRIRALRIQKGMHQQDIADILEKSRSYISELESGKRTISYQVLMRFCEIFNVGLEYFDIRKEQTDSDEIEKRFAKIEKEISQLKNHLSLQ